MLSRVAWAGGAGGGGEGGGGGGGVELRKAQQLT